MAVSRLLKSWATPPASWPTASSFPAWLIVLDRRLHHADHAGTSVDDVLLLHLDATVLGKDQAIVGAVLVGQVRRIEIEVGLADEVRLRDSQRLAEGTVGGHEAQVAVLEEDALGQVLDERAVLRLAGSQRLVHPSPLGDIREDAVEPQRAAVGAGRGHDAVAHPAHGAVGPDDAVLLLAVALLFGDAGLQALFDARPVLGMDGFQPALQAATIVIRRAAGNELDDRGRKAIMPAAVAVELAAPDAIGDGVEDAAQLGLGAL